eukprot:c2367_g1_i1.p1 GENE.c2367_g1_i1~~c2367_g1_i1.p1  ORF type:complete len:482 (-),score=98.73 c2367_g1_i1:468-1913(-)
MPRVDWETISTIMSCDRYECEEMWAVLSSPDPLTVQSEIERLPSLSQMLCEESLQKVTASTHNSSFDLCTHDFVDESPLPKFSGSNGSSSSASIQSFVSQHFEQTLDAPLKESTLVGKRTLLCDHTTSDDQPLPKRRANQNGASSSDQSSGVSLTQLKHMYLSSLQAELELANTTTTTPATTTTTSMTTPSSTPTKPSFATMTTTARIVTPPASSRHALFSPPRTTPHRAGVAVNTPSNFPSVRQSTFKNIPAPAKSQDRETQANEEEIRSLSSLLWVDSRGAMHMPSWMQPEDVTLIIAVRTYGQNWQKVQRHLGTGVAVSELKVRWELLRLRAREQQRINSPSGSQAMVYNSSPRHTPTLSSIHHTPPATALVKPFALTKQAIPQQDHSHKHQPAPPIPFISPFKPLIDLHTNHTSPNKSSLFNATNGHNNKSNNNNTGGNNGNELSSSVGPLKTSARPALVHTPNLQMQLTRALGRQK